MRVFGLKIKLTEKKSHYHFESTAYDDDRWQLKNIIHILSNKIIIIIIFNDFDGDFIKSRIYQ